MLQPKDIKLMWSSWKLVVQKHAESAFSCNSIFISYSYCLRGIKHGSENPYIGLVRELVCVGWRKDVSVWNTLIIRKLVVGKLWRGYWRCYQFSNILCAKKTCRQRTDRGYKSSYILHAAKGPAFLSGKSYRSGICRWRQNKEEVRVIQIVINSFR